MAIGCREGQHDASIPLILLSGLFILALPACATGYPSEYAAEAIEAWVITPKQTTAGRRHRGGALGWKVAFISA